MCSCYCSGLFQPAPCTSPFTSWWMQLPDGSCPQLQLFLQIGGCCGLLKPLLHLSPVLPLRGSSGSCSLAQPSFPPALAFVLAGGFCGPVSVMLRYPLPGLPQLCSCVCQSQLQPGLAPMHTTDAVAKSGRSQDSPAGRIHPWLSCWFVGETLQHSHQIGSLIWPQHVLVDAFAWPWEALQIFPCPSSRIYWQVQWSDLWKPLEIIVYMSNEPSVAPVPVCLQSPGPRQCVVSLQAPALWALRAPLSSSTLMLVGTMHCVAQKGSTFLFCF